MHEIPSSDKFSLFSTSSVNIVQVKAKFSIPWISGSKDCNASSKEGKGLSDKPMIGFKILVGSLDKSVTLVAI